MSLADDMRTGAAMSDPAHAHYLRRARPGSTHKFAACALGCVALARGSGNEGEGGIILDLESWYPELMNVRVEHPVVGTSFRLWDAVTDLNDRMRWSRESIADWIDTLTVDLTTTAVREEVPA